MALSVKIRKDFGSFKLDVAFEADNRVTGLLGASGCGKSMTLRCIAGIVKPDEGKIVLDGVTLFDSEKHINLPPQERQVGLLFQNYALFPNMTVEQNLMTGLCREKDRSVKQAAVKEMMKKFYLTGLEKHHPSQLSGGQQQRVALARILISKPKILMLDEPFSALDSYLKWELEMELADRLKEFTGTTLLVSHSRDEVYRLCDHVCVISEGTSQPVVSIRELFDAPRTQAAALLSGCKNYSRAVPAGDRQVTALDWGVTLQCGRPVPGHITMLGVRSHYLAPCKADAVNAIEGLVTRVVDDVFSTVIMVRPVTAVCAGKNSSIRMELPKEEAAAIREGDHIHIGVSPTDILLLE